MQPSPYTPGEVAREVPGRGKQLGEADERLSYMIDLGRLVARIRVDHAARGIGKTSLLRQISRHAQERQAVTVWVTAGEQNRGLIASVGQGIEEQTRSWRSETRGRVRKALDHMTLTVGMPGIATIEIAGVQPAATDPAEGGVREFEHLIKETVDSARREDCTGLVLFIDEIQAADPAGLRTLAYAWQHLQSEAPDLQAAVFTAGLPNSPETLAAAVTFSERLFAYRHLGYLDDQAAHVALTQPAVAQGVEWDEDALATALAEVQGYPYFIQLVGEQAWIAAGYPDAGAHITAAHVTAAIATMTEDVTALYRARWELATPMEKRFMQAMAQLGDEPVQRREVARIMGVTSADLAVPRQRLLDKGLIEAPARGQLAFPIPGFAEHVRQRIDGPVTE